MDANNIKVYNHTLSFLGAPLRDRSLGFEPANDGVPSVENLTLSEVEYMNSHSIAIRSGMLEFDEDVRDEIYAALRLPNWKTTCLFERDIDSLLVDYSEENSQKIIDTKDVLNLERIRAHSVYHQSAGDLDISVRMADLINKRYKELNSGIVNSMLRIVKAPAAAGKSEDLQALIAAEVAKALQQKSELTEEVVAPVATITPEPAKVANTTAKIATKGTRTSAKAKAAAEAEAVKESE